MRATSLLTLAVILGLILTLATACPTNCSDCDPTGSICFACQESFELAVTGECFGALTVPMCTLYGPTKQCFVCQPTYSLDASGNCLKNGSPCLTTDPFDDQLCTDCGFGTLLSAGKCLGAINCLSAQNTCSACASGFTLANGRCQDSSGNCDSVGSDGACVNCKTGFALNGYRCVASNVQEFACYIWDQKQSCQVCKSGYNLYQGYCLLPLEIRKVIQGTATLSQVLASRQQTTTTPGNTNPDSDAGGGGFGSFGNTDFGFGGFDTTPTTTLTDTSSNSGNFGFGGNSGFGTSSFGTSGFGTSGSGTSSATSASTLPAIANCEVLDLVNVGKCRTCVQGYYPSGSSCVKVSVFCQASNVLTGDCLSCKYSLRLSSGKCLDANCNQQTGNGCTACKDSFLPDSNAVCQFADPNCLSLQPTRCGQCAANYFITFEGQCRALPANCTAANSQTYACLQCAQGYQISLSGGCALKVVVAVLPANCLRADIRRSNFCLTCNSGYTVNNGVCRKVQTPVVPYCESYNLLTGICISCLNGYFLSSGNCLPDAGGTVTLPTTPATLPSNGSSGVANRDPNCLNYVNNVCTACSNRYYFGSNQLCVPINPLCKDYLVSGSCTSCYPGYNVSAGSCILSLQTRDPSCKTFSSVGVCTVCYAGFFYSQASVRCLPFNPLCKTSSLADGTCTACFPGYSLSSGSCGIAFLDPNCQQFDLTTKTLCLKCSNRFYLGPDGKCRQINPLCKTADSLSGNCLSCYPGYVVQNGLCEIGGTSTIDTNCQKFENGVCMLCSNRFYLSLSSGQCTQSDPLCKTSSSSNGACLSCYPGYVISQNSCVIGSSSGGSGGSGSSGDPNCKATNAIGACSGCYDSFYLSARATCLRLDPLCKGYTASKDGCSGCYQGYSLAQGKCVIPVVEVASGSSDTFCIRSEGIVCVQCSNGYFLNASRRCTQLNPLCKNSDLATGHCTDCYQGYELSAPTCVIAAVAFIPYCATIVGSACTSCISGYYVQNGACMLANTLCATYDPNSGSCFSCILGYVFQRGQCIMPSLGVDYHCTNYENSFCTACVTDYALVNYFCAAVDPNCSDFDAVRNICRACLNSRVPQGAKCV